MNFLERRIPAFVIILAISAIVFGGCRENTLIKSSLAPAADTVGVEADTLDCITHTFYNDDVLTSINLSGLPEFQAVGAISDSFFGTTNASTYFQITNSGDLVGFDTAAINHIDSVVLNLPFAGFAFGDSANLSLKETFQVFYLQDTLGYATNYYPSSTKAIDLGNPLSAPATVNLYNLKDSVVDEKGHKHTPALRIRLDKTATWTRIKSAVALGASSTDPASAFVNNFLGVCVRTADARKFNTVLPYFNLSGSDDYSRAGILVFYHSLDAPDSARHFAFSHEQSLCAHFNNITRSYSRFPLNKLMNSTQANDSIVALQNQPGATIDVKISGLNSIPKNVVINKAEIQLSLVPGLNSSKFFPHDQIYPLGVGDGTWPAGVTAGAEYTVQDRYPLGSTTPYNILDGAPHNIGYGSTTVTTYKIGIPREVISSIGAGHDSLHYHVRGTQLYPGAYRAIIAGGNYSDPRYKAKLIVVYSSLKK